MNILKLLVTAAAVAVILTATRPQAGTLAPRERGRRPRPADWEEEEPVLGYDGMDPATLIPWLEDADLDDATLQRIYDYERAHEGRQRVLDTVEALMR